MVFVRFLLVLDVLFGPCILFSGGYCRTGGKTLVSVGCIEEGLDGGVWNSLISKNLAHYSLSLKVLLIL